MTPFQQIAHEISEPLEQLHRRIAGQLHTDNALMQRVIDNYLEVKGKLIRPILVILTAQLFGPVHDKVLGAAAAVELLHNGSLIHDDVVDQSAMRRGRPTVNATWDNHIAVLVGDFFVSSSMQQAIGTGDVRIIDALCHLGKLLSLGELDQICTARHHTLSLEAYLHNINYKTASLFVACARMGCYAQGVDDWRADTLVRYAELLGLCFQIRDDIFDYYADAAVGKPTGNDLLEGKVTLPLLHVLLSRGDAEAEAMRTLATRGDLTAPEVARLTAYAVRHGGVDHAYSVMEDYERQGAALLQPLGDTPGTRRLQALFKYIIARAH